MGDGSRYSGIREVDCFIQPNWRLLTPGKGRVQALCSTRQGGVSLPPFDTFNLALHVGDAIKAVQKNRQILQKNAKIPSPVCWLDQQHTTKGVYFHAPQDPQQPPPVADASWTDQPHVVLAVMTADCMPILVTNQAQTVVAAIHAGWKGCLNGVIENTVAQLPDKPENLVAWIGPCIRQSNFEVGEEVMQAFVSQDPAASAYFSSLKAGKTYADLAGLGQLALKRAGVQTIFDSGLDSFTQKNLFYSYRREGQTGRMASLIWLSSDH